MKWRNVRGDVGTDSIFWGLVGALLVLAILLLAAAAGGGIAGALAGIGA